MLHEGAPTLDPDIAARFAALMGDTALLVALFDPQERLIRSNPAFRKAFWVEEDERVTWVEIMRRNQAAGVGTVVATDDFENWLASVRSRRGKLPFRAFETDLLDGRWLWMTETTDRAGWMLCVASDITSLRVEERALRMARDIALRASQTDSLTGIANRRAILARLEALTREAAGTASALSVALLDIDHFKQINDRYGHHLGDQVLMDFTRSCEPFIRRHDGFGRIGGEEFMLLLPDTGPVEADAILRRLLAAVAGSAPLPSAPTFRYSCSAGFATCRLGDTPQTLYARADAALYGAKRAGRARVEQG